LTFFPRYTNHNQNYSTLFTAINVNTRFVYAYAAKKKDAFTILQLLKKMESKTIINSITCDEGSEFNNRQFIRYCNENDIYIYFVKDDSHKLGIMNRFHRTLKDKLSKYFAANNTVIWFDVIDEIVNNYNHSVNRGIGVAPIDCNSFIERDIIESKRRATEILKESIKEFEIGDKVFVKKKEELFQDKMIPIYSKRRYTIVKMSNNSVLLVNSNGEESRQKKTDIIKISKTENGPINEDAIIEHVSKEHSKKVRFDRTGLEEDNIVLSKRLHKKKVVIDL
jgi:hypothetical protein